MIIGQNEATYLTEISYNQVKNITNGIILVNSKLKDQALNTVKEWIFRKAGEYSDLTEKELDETIKFIEQPKTANEINKNKMTDKVNKLAKAQSELAKDKKYTLQFIVVSWVEDIIIITK